MEREVNEEKRNKFIEYAGKRVNNTQEQANTVAEKVQAAISEEVVEEISSDDVLAEVISDEIGATNL